MIVVGDIDPTRKRKKENRPIPFVGRLIAGILSWRSIEQQQQQLQW